MVTRKGRDGWPVVSLCASELSRHTRHPLYPTHSQTERQSNQIFRGTSGLFLLHSVAGFTFSPGQSCGIFAGENLGFPTAGLHRQAAISAPGGFLLFALTREAGGPWLKPQISKKNVKPLELVILLSDTHFKRISLLLPLKHVLVLFSTLNT